jgi:hypothetical protein
VSAHGVRRQLDAESPALGHGIARIGGDVEDHQFEFAVVEHHGHGRGLLREFEGDGGWQQLPQHRLHRDDRLGRIEHLRARQFVPAEGKQLPGEYRAAIRGGGDAAERLVDGGFLLVAPLDVEMRIALRGVAGDQAQNVSEVVCDSAGEAASGFQLLCMDKLGLYAFARMHLALQVATTLLRLAQGLAQRIDRCGRGSG